jgi:hypothetical protein
MQDFPAKVAVPLVAAMLAGCGGAANPSEMDHVASSSALAAAPTSTSSSWRTSTASTS